MFFSTSSVIPFVLLIGYSKSSILDNRTTNQTLPSMNQTIIRAERNPMKDVEYQPAPTRDGFKGIDQRDKSQIFSVERLCGHSNCGYGNDESIYPFIAATVFMILAIVTYIILFCFVLRYVA